MPNCSNKITAILLQETTNSEVQTMLHFNRECTQTFWLTM